MSYSFRVTFDSAGQAIVTNLAGEPPADGAYFYVSGHDAQSIGVSLQGPDGQTVMQAGGYCPAAHLPEPPAPAPAPAPAPEPPPAPAPVEAAPTVPDPVPSSPPAPPPYPTNPAADPTQGAF